MKLTEIANEEYYNNEEPILTDQEFDLLSDDGLDISNFRKKTDHHQPMGSLKKIKTEEDFLKWVNGDISVTPKLDGNSIEVIFHNGEFVKAVTRGNGFIGNDVTDKIEHCKFIGCPKMKEGTYSYKAEAIMKKVHQKDYEKNIRNVVSGLINKKEVDAKELAKIDIVFFDTLENKKFNYNATVFNTLEAMFHHYKNNYEYEIDGLVVELETPFYEETDELLPENKIALKFNKEGVPAVVGKIEWTLGKHGKLCPTIVLESPVIIDGTNVNRVYTSNYRLIKEAGLGIGANVTVMKAGDIIPQISSVIKKSQILNKIVCPECGQTPRLNDTQVDLVCVNPNCRGIKLEKLKNIFKIFDLEFISESTVELLYNNGYDSITKIFNANKKELESLEGFGPKKADNLIKKLKGIEITEAQALECAMVKGISKKNADKIISYYSDFDNFILKVNKDSLMDIDDIGGILADGVMKELPEIIKMYDELKSCGVKIKKNEVSGDKGNIVFTGTCSQHPRKELEKILMEMGYKIQSGVTKTTNLLLTDGIISGTKVEKANKLGVEIKTYAEFFQEKN